jgi:hypothetical protein
VGPESLVFQSGVTLRQDAGSSFVYNFYQSFNLSRRSIGAVVFGGHLYDV